MIPTYLIIISITVHNAVNASNCELDEAASKQPSQSESHTGPQLPARRHHCAMWCAAAAAATITLSERHGQISTHRPTALIHLGVHTKAYHYNNAIQFLIHAQFCGHLSSAWSPSAFPACSGLCSEFRWDGFFFFFWGKFA